MYKKLILPALMILALTSVSSKAQALEFSQKRYYTAKVYDADGTLKNKRMWLNLHTQSNPSCTRKPFVLLVHGGGFTSGSRTGKMNDRAIALAHQGFAAASMDYRLVRDRPHPDDKFRKLIGEGLEKSDGFLDDFMDMQAVSYSGINWVVSKYSRGEGDGVSLSKRKATAMAAAAEDVYRAIKWARDNASTLCIDANRISVIGESAGSIAAMNAIYAAAEYGVNMPDIRSVVNIVGGYMHMDLLERSSPKILSIHGTYDTVVPYRASAILHNTAQNIGMNSTFLPINNGSHTMDLSTTTYGGNSLEWHILRFLRN